MSNSNDRYLGFFFGLLLIFSQIDLQVGMLVFLGGIALITYDVKDINSDSMALIVIAFFQVSLMFLSTYINDGEMILLIKDIAPMILLLIIIRKNFSSQFVKGVAEVFLILVFVDMIFNIVALLFHIDILGRGVIKRPSDLLPRLGGVFHHPFSSINLMFSGVICGFILRSRWIILLSMFFLLITGSLRGPLLLCLIMSMIVAINFLKHKFFIVVVGASFIVFVILITYFFQGDSIYSANSLRVFSWNNALFNIINSPIIGQSFNNVELTAMSQDIIVENGISESSILKLGAQYGLVALFFHILFLYQLQKKSFSFADESSFLYLSVPLIVTVVIVDRFYGNLFNSSAIPVLIGLLISRTIRKDTIF